jgi:Uma2 family endonuclease
VTLGLGSAVRWTAPDGPWTEPDLHLFPQDGHRYEIVDGSLHVTPPPDGPHRSVVRALVGTLRSAAPDGWWVCDRLGIDLGGSNLVPDVTVLRPMSSGAVWTDPADVALVVEVETESSRRYDRLLKPTVYADAGIPQYWRIELNLAAPVVHLYALSDDGAYTLHHSIKDADAMATTTPYPVHIAPSTWT